MDGVLFLLVGAVGVVIVMPIVALVRTRRIADLAYRLASIEDRLIDLTAENLRMRAAIEELEAAPRACAGSRRSDR